jgi:uncharacterized protein YigA (DUF484 family)
MNTATCVLITLNIRSWEANRQDRRVSEEVAVKNNVTDQRLCRLRKSLLPKTSVMDRLDAVMRAARTFHYQNTHTWLHNGPRILTRANYDSYMLNMRRYKADFDTGVKDFVAQYGAIKELAKTVLGQLYLEEDYPAKDTLEIRYGFETSIQPLPAPASLLDMGFDDGAETKARLESEMDSIFQQANMRLWRDLFDRVSKLNAKLQDDKAYVSDDYLEGTMKLAEMMPRMALTEDLRLAVLSHKLCDSLKGVTAAKLKLDPHRRHVLARDIFTVFGIMRSHQQDLAPSAALLAVEAA